MPKTRRELWIYRETLDAMRDHATEVLKGDCDSLKWMRRWEALGHAIELIDAEIAALPAEDKASAAA